MGVAIGECHTLELNKHEVDKKQKFLFFSLLFCQKKKKKKTHITPIWKIKFQTGDWTDTHSWGHTENRPISIGTWQFGIKSVGWIFNPPQRPTRKRQCTIKNKVVLNRALFLFLFLFFFFEVCFVSFWLEYSIRFGKARFCFAAVRPCLKNSLCEDSFSFWVWVGFLFFCSKNEKVKLKENKNGMRKKFRVFLFFLFVLFCFETTKSKFQKKVVMQKGKKERISWTFLVFFVLFFVWGVISVFLGFRISIFSLKK